MQEQSEEEYIIYKTNATPEKSVRDRMKRADTAGDILMSMVGFVIG